MSGALTIPDPRQNPVPRGWFTDVAAPVLSGVTEPDHLDDYEAQLKTLISYIESYDGDVTEFEKALRMIERNRGVLADVDVKPGERTDLPTRGEVDAPSQTVSRWRMIARAWDDVVWPVLVEATRRQDVTQAAILRLIQSRAPAPEPIVTPGFPNGPFRTVVLDPPWPIEKVSLQRRPVEDKPLDYATMSLEEIEALPVSRLADPRGAHVYLWITHKLLPYGFKLFASWGVRYECLLTWYKPTAQPLWWMYNTEHVLFGKVGQLPPLKKGSPVGFKAPQQRHSHKPNEFFDLVCSVSPEPRLTMFDGEREGFTSWGVVHAA